MPRAENNFSFASDFPGLQSSSNSLERNGKSQKVAAIDIGTNSTHLLLASVEPELGSFSIELAEKSTTRLGENQSDSDFLSESAMERVIDTLKRFKDLAASYKVEQIVTAATSAVREALNGIEFVDRIKKELGIEVNLVSGQEEARLIYLGVLSGIPFGEDPHILLDIGGGSTELILADGRDARALTSTRVGAVRLQRDLVNQDPLSKDKREFLQAFIQGSLEPAVKKVRSRIDVGEQPAMVATSGTAMAIAALTVMSEGKTPLKMNGYKLSRQKLDEVIDQLVMMSLEERCNLPSLNERRAEIIVPGALILQTSMHMLDVDELILSERALREGLIVDWMLRKGFLKDRFSFQSSIRQRTVVHQVKRFAVDQKRASYVAQLALNIFDQTNGVLHEGNIEARALLWAAAMLHSCGQHINLSAYHKHSWYLIRHGELLGYSQSEHLIIAAIARYHRRSLPKKRHEAWQALSNRKDRKIVFEMSIILRLAATLNKRPEPVISNLKVYTTDSKIIMELMSTSEQDLSLEKWSLENCASIVHDSCGKNLHVNV